MTSFKAVRHALLVLSACVLVACDTVEFQSPPSEALACDPLLVGDWLVEDLRREPSSEKLYVRVTAECDRWYSIEVAPDENGQIKADVDDLEQDLQLAFARTEQQRFLTARDRPDASAAGATLEKPNGYVLIAYDQVDESITLRQIDVKRTAHLIVDGKAPGWIDKRDRRPNGSSGAYASAFWVYVFGSVAETKTLLDEHDLLDAPWMRLMPVEASTSAKLSAWIAEPRQPE